MTVMKTSIASIVATGLLCGCALFKYDPNAPIRHYVDPCKTSMICPGDPRYYQIQQIKELKRLNRNLERQARQR